MPRKKKISDPGAAEASRRFKRMLREREKLQEALSNFRQHLPLPPGRDITLEHINDLVLTAVRFFHGQGSTLQIARKLDDLGEHTFDAATTLITLSRLERQGLISSRRVEMPPKSGAFKTKYTITPEGERRLAKARVDAKRLLDALKEDE
jgi:hypothetical protein